MISEFLANLLLAGIIIFAMILTAAPTWAWLGLGLAVLILMNNIDLGAK